MNSFEIISIPGKGKGMIAVKDFAEHETIFEEEPFVSCQFSWNEAYGYAACNHCLRPLETIAENVHRLTNDPSHVVPFLDRDPTLEWQQQFTICPKCKIRYCSEDCRREALKIYHRVECMGIMREHDDHPINILNEVWKKMHYPPETGTILLLVRLMAIYKQTNNKEQFLETLGSFQSHSVNTEHQIYHKMLGSSFELQLEQLYKSFCAAFSDEEYSAFTSPEAFKALMAIIGTNSQGIATSVLAQWVQIVSALDLPDTQKEQLDEYIEQLYEKVENFAGAFLNNEGAGLYILQSKINHSCVPNAISSFPYSNDIVVLKALHPIKQGEEICISYLDCCQLNRSRHSRQKLLKENYIFICECPKCEIQKIDPDVSSEDEDDSENAMDTDDDM